MQKGAAREPQLHSTQAGGPGPLGLSKKSGLIMKCCPYQLWTIVLGIPDIQSTSLEIFLKKFNS